MLTNHVCKSSIYFSINIVPKKSVLSISDFHTKPYFDKFDFMNKLSIFMLFTLIMFSLLLN